MDKKLTDKPRKTDAETDQDTSAEPSPQNPEIPYPVGYGRPPKRSQFKPGQSGNPKGRRKGSRNFKTDVLEVLNEGHTLSKDGRKQKISGQRAALLRLKEKALNGDLRSLVKLLDLAQYFNVEERAALELPPLPHNDKVILADYVRRKTTSDEDPSDQRPDLPDEPPEK